jgi:hypothetical protein
MSKKEQNLPECASYERIVWVNDNYEVSDGPKDGYAPVKVSKFAYLEGRPEQYFINLKKMSYGPQDESKPRKPFAGIEFTPLAYFDFGFVVMYPQADADGKEASDAPRKRTSVIAYLHDEKKIVSLLFSSFTAQNFMNLMRRQPHLNPIGQHVPITALKLSGVEAKTKNKHGDDVDLLDFKVGFAPRSFTSELNEWLEQAAPVLFCSDHVAEVLTQPGNQYNIVSGVVPGWMKSLSAQLSDGGKASLLQAVQERGQRHEGKKPEALEPEPWLALPEPGVPSESLARYRAAPFNRTILELKLTEIITSTTKPDF